MGCGAVVAAPPSDVEIAPDPSGDPEPISSVDSQAEVHTFPAYWKNTSSASSSFDCLKSVESGHHATFDELLRETYVAVCTQDRPCPTGKCKKTPSGCACVQVYPKDLLPDLPPEVPGLPIGYRVRKVIRNEDSRMWGSYARKCEEIRENRKGETFRQLHPPPLTSKVVEKCSNVFGELDKEFNEVYVWHGTTVKAALSIADNDFKVDLAGSSKGTMYGNGVYLAESCTKADEYAKDEPGTPHDGVFALLLCRVFMGKLYYTTKRDEHAQQRVEGGEFDSVLGDRRKSAGTFREFVAYDQNQIYPEYVVFYHRVHVRDDPKQVEDKLKMDLELGVPVT